MALKQKKTKLGFIVKFTPIKSVPHTLKDISEGEGDLTKSIQQKGNDENAELTKYFNNTLENIRNLVGSIKYIINAFINTGHELTVNMTKTSSAVDDIPSNFEDTKNLEAKQKRQHIVFGN